MRAELTHYGNLLGEIKLRIRSAQGQAAQAVNAELVRLYWDIGCLIGARQVKEGWGAGVIPRLARDLHNELPEHKGFSERNLKLMVQFAREYPALFAIGQTAVAQLNQPNGPGPIGQTPFAQLPWAHNVLLVQKVKDTTSRLWYGAEAK